MNKEEIEAKLHNYEERLKDIAKAIEELRDQVAKVEKPKLRHGDFGLSQDGSPRLIVKEKVYDKGGVCGYTNGPDDYYTIFGNIFDLMKDWCKDLTEFEMEAPATNVKVEARGSFVAFIDPSDRNEINVSSEKIEEFWRKLGQLVMTLKKKQ